jgi:hypothetical protein
VALLCHYAAVVRCCRALLSFSCRGAVIVIVRNIGGAAANR